MVIVSDQINIELDRERVCRCLGYSDDRKPSRQILNLIDEYLENAYQLIEPSYLHVVRDIEWVQDSCVLVGGSGGLIHPISCLKARLLPGCWNNAIKLGCS